jgi:hypothetical protein
VSNAHTPGPWAANHRHIAAPRYSIITLPNGTVVPVGCAIANTDKGPTIGQSVANARLIAESPAMFDLLRDVEKSISFVLRVTADANPAKIRDVRTELKATVKDIREVLNRIEGK